MANIFDTPDNKTSTLTNSSQISTAGPEAWMASKGKSLYNSAAGSLGKTFTPYKYNRVADYGAGYDQSKSILNTMMGDTGWTWGQNRGKLDELWGANKGAMTKTDADYMSPYTDQVLQPQLREIDEARRTQGLEDNRAATMAGAFGDPQAGIRRATSNAKFTQQIADTTGKTYNDAFMFGHNARESEL